MIDEMLDTQQAMSYLGVKRTRLYKYVQQGKIKIYKSKSNAKLSYFKKIELDELRGFVEAQEIHQPRADEMADLLTAVAISENEKANGVRITQTDIKKMIAEMVAEHRVKQQQISA